MLDLAIKINDDGEYFPVWGTCLGFEAMLVIVANNTKVLSIVNSTNHSDDLKFNKNAMMSKMFSRLPEKMRNVMMHDKPLHFNHKFAINLKSFAENENLKNFFDVLTVSTDL
jgi:gamma-glutamyl hydrolase